MANFKNIAVIHFQKKSEHVFSSDSMQDVLMQFEQATQRLEKTGIDIVVTCEGMAAVGQTMEQVESFNQPGPLMEAYAKFAKQNHCCVVGSTKLKDNGKIFNAQVVFENDGSFAGDYRKVFLTDDELLKGMTPGKRAKVIETESGTLGGVICFDLNFNELKDEYATLHPDILAFSSMFHGGFMQQEWAFRCRCFFAAALKDGNSVILDPLGRVLTTANLYTLVGRARINLDRFVFHLDKNIIKVSDIYRKYGNDVFIDVEPALGTGVLYSLSDSISAVQIASEFNIIHIDDYLKNARSALHHLIK